MVDIPETRYARNGSVSIAYQVLGDGPIAVVYAGAGATHLDYSWRHPPVVRFGDRFAEFGRLVIYDKRGCGLSDRTARLPTVEENVGDLVAVLDDAGIETANLFGDHEGGATVLALAAAHPERVERVGVYGSFARFVRAADYPIGLDRATAEAFAEHVVADWGGPRFLRAVAPLHADDPELASWFRAQNRAAVSPAGAADWFDNWLRLDVRDLLGDVAAPVLVVNRQSDSGVDPRHSRYLAEHLPNARHVESPGTDHFLWVGDTDAVLDEVEEFFTGQRPTPTATRALATVMFTDIVDSTGRAAEVGDTAWRNLLTRHDDRTRHHVEAHRGRVVKSTGDGALATFDTPDQAINAAQALIADLARVGIELRIGLHMGQVEILGDDVAGVGVHLAARINALAQPGEVLVSGTVRDLLLGSDLTFDGRGTHELKGVPGEWEVLAVTFD